MTTLVLNHCGRPVPRKFVHFCLGSFTQALKSKRLLRGGQDKELVVVFVDEAQARSLNRQYRKKDYATDVLSFESQEPESFGELVLCLDVVRRQARDHRLSVKEELSYLLLHGLLHLLGFDHEKDQKAAKRMFALQDLIWNAFWSRQGRSK
ncbi:MAG: rRNA maturation RNase YbeY [Bdellovibrionales bacterium]|nr:rRNA maturation RNase YbeY [Bdellovibrionales bacterium]